MKYKAASLHLVRSTRLSKPGHHITAIKDTVLFPQ